MVDFTRLNEVRCRRPLIHCISNIVTANDCANLALAAGASPMMAQEPREMADITAAAEATVLNTGTPDEARFEACLICGREAEKLGRPVVLDPVGVGASPWRLERTGELLRQFIPTLLRVNLGEAQALLRINSQEKGVDSPAPAPQSQRIETAVRLARRYGTAVLLSGPEDIVTDGTDAWCVSGGSEWMSRVTGTGCMLSVLCGVFAAAEPDALTAGVLAAAFWKTCSSRAEAAGRGTGSFRTALLDEASVLTAAELSKESRLKKLTGDFSSLGER